MVLCEFRGDPAGDCGPIAGETGLGGNERPRRERRGCALAVCVLLLVVAEDAVYEDIQRHGLSVGS